ncbi:MAG: IS4 family transposase [Acidobacteria bacterium]|nr:IS4 family transposase [Acidobacteriota bacterium]
MLDSFRAAVTAARRHGDLYFAALLSEQSILNSLGSASSLWQGWVYTPAVTVWVFLSQCLSADHSCRDAVARLAAWRVTKGLSPCSAETGGYCIARSHLPEEACRRLVRQTGQELENEAPAEWLWQGRRVRVVDGSTVTMADTPQNQAEYPQLKSQKAGCGFPIGRIVVVFSLAVGTVVEAAIGKYEGKQTGENSMFRTIAGCLADGDVVLADRYFGGWFDLALLKQRGVDMVVRKHQLRATDFRTGQRLGKDDQLVRWSKPQRPKWMTPEQYASLPDELVLREVRVRVKQKGFRTKSLVVVTTLTDANEDPAAQIAELYRRRWQAELNLRSLKVVLQMDQLRCKTPQRVRNEFYMHLLAYNLIRRAMALAAFQSGVCPWQVSFKGALQTLNNFLPLLACQPSVDAWCQALADAIATHRVANRPDRYEPRLTKRRPKKYKHLREPRANYKRRAA